MRGIPVAVWEDAEGTLYKGTTFIREPNWKPRFPWDDAVTICTEQLRYVGISRDWLLVTIKDMPDYCKIEPLTWN